MANFQYTFGTSKTRAAIPENDGKSWIATLKGTHRATADRITIAGRSCTMTPIVRDVEIGVSANGKQATIDVQFVSACGQRLDKMSRGGGGGSGVGADARRRKLCHAAGDCLRATRRTSSKTKSAQAAQGMMKVSGTYNSTLTIICPAEKK